MTWHVLSVGWNAWPYIQRCAQSVLAQVGVDARWHVTLDDAVGDPQADKWAASLVGWGVDVSLIKGRYYAMRNLAAMLNEIDADPNDRVALVDLDDALANDRALATAEKYHEAGAWITHGSYSTTSGRPPKFHGAYPAGANLRVAKWRATHLRTFRYGLWKHIRPRDLRGADGQWFRAAYDLAMMLPLMELAGPERVKHIPDTLYVYNDTSADNDHKVRFDEQKRCERWIRRLPKYRKVEML